MSDDLCRDDAAYVLGALSASDRRAFESHLETCAQCQRAVRDLDPLPRLMATVRPADFDAPAEVPPATLLLTLTEVVNRRRRRRRSIAAASIAAAAAAVVIAVTVARIESPSQPVQVARPMVAVEETAVRASAVLTDEPWGTRITVACSYDRSSPYRPKHRYTLVVVNRAGSTEQIASWNVVPDQVSSITGSVGWDRASIARVEIRTLGGSPVLSLRV